jgi:hypothetical protein
MLSEDTGRVVDELAAVIRRIEEVEQARRAGDATAAAQLDQLYRRKDELEARLFAMRPRSPSDALAMAGLAAGLLGRLRHCEVEDDEAGACNAKAHDLLTAVIHHLAASLPGADAASVATILRWYVAIS